MKKIGLLAYSRILSAVMSTELLPQIARGDQQAVRVFVKKYSGLVWSLVKKQIAHQQDAEELVQEIFINIWQSAGRYQKAKSSETTFVAMITKRRIIDKLRKKYRQADTDAYKEGDHASRGDKKTESYTDVKVAWAAIQDLPEAKRDVLALCFLHGYSQSEVASKLGISLGTVKSHYRRGLQSLRDKLSKGGQS